MSSKYLAQFSKAREHLRLRGNRLLVEVLPKEEIKTKGGLVIASSLSDHRTNTDMNRADVAVVLAVGEGYYDDDTGADVAMDIKVGNVVLISRYGLRTYSSFPGVTNFVADTIALCRDNDINAVWEDAAAFEAYRQAMEVPSDAQTEG